MGLTPATFYKDLQQQIITLLEATLTGIKFYFGEPNKEVNYPYGFVEIVSGTVEEQTVGKNIEEVIIINIAILDRNAVKDDSEKSVLDKAVSIRNVIETDETLNGKVTDSRMISFEMGRIDDEKQNYSVTGWLWTMEAQHNIK